MEQGCKSCTTETGRKPGCHSTCPTYKAYRELIDKRNENRQNHFFNLFEMTPSRKTKPMRRKGPKNGEV